ncbi:MAG: transporter substrate-binding domain-containing protein [Pseudomonadaceae bacterium]|nr:transporter substrate-binding domain-containing protein [Pseudomonadaceae bacterium]
MATLSLLSVCATAEPTQPSEALTALIVESAPLGIKGPSGEPVGISIDLLALLSRELGREIEPLLVPRNELINRLTAQQFDLVLLYEREGYKDRFDYLGRFDDISHVQVVLAETDTNTISTLGHVVQMAPPPSIAPPEEGPPFFVYPTITAAYEALTEGEIDALLLPQPSARVILNEAPFTSGIAFKSLTVSSWPLGLYARRGALTGSETQAALRTLAIVKEEQMIDSFLERFYQQHAQLAAKTEQPPAHETGQ